MPRGDGTGPFGTFVKCMPVDSQGNAMPRPFGFRRFYRGRGPGMGGRGRGNMYRFLATGVPGWASFSQGYQPPAQPTKEQEIQALEQEKKAIEQDLSEINKHIEELKKQQ